MIPGVRLAAFARRHMLPSLVHRYTKTSRVAGAETPLGGATYTDGTPESGFSCLYTEHDALQTSAAGQVTVSVPILVIDRDDDLQAGEKVSNIVDRAGNVLEAGPLEVEEVKLISKSGGLWRKQATLRTARAI